MVGTDGIEPLTSCMSSMRSNQLSYAPGTIILYHISSHFASGKNNKDIRNIEKILCNTHIFADFKAISLRIQLFVMVICHERV